MHLLMSSTRRPDIKPATRYCQNPAGPSYLKPSTNSDWQDRRHFSVLACRDSETLDCQGLFCRCWQSATIYQKISSEDEPSCSGNIGNVLFCWDYWTDKIAPAESSRGFSLQNEAGRLSLEEGGGFSSP